MDTISSDATKVPQAIEAYQAAHDRRDVPTALAQFADDASVVDDGHTHDGITGVESFLRRAATDYTFTRTLVSASGAHARPLARHEPPRRRLPGGTRRSGIRVSSRRRTHHASRHRTLISPR